MMRKARMSCMVRLLSGHIVSIKDVLKAFIALARKTSRKLTMMVAGSNKIALEVAFSSGFTISIPYLLLSSQPCGNWDRYLFHSPGMM